MIEILSQAQVSNCSIGVVILAFTIAILTVAGLAFDIFVCCKCEKFDKVDCIVSVIFVFIAIGLIVIGCVSFKESRQTHTEYKVLISDDANFKEFNDKYEVVNQDGKIYTIKERVDESVL